MGFTRRGAERLVFLGSGAVVGGAGALAVGLNTGWLLTPDTRDRGRNVVWQQQEEDIRHRLWKVLPTLHNYPDLWVGPYSRSNDSALRMEALEKRKFRDRNVSLLLPFFGTPSEFYYTKSRFIDMKGEVRIRQTEYEQQDGVPVSAFADENFEKIINGAEATGRRIDFFDFEKFNPGHFPDPNLGYMAVLIPLEGTLIPKAVGDRFVFVFQRQANKVWTPLGSPDVYAVEKNTNGIKKGLPVIDEHYISVGWNTYDPKKPHPRGFVTYKGFEIPITQSMQYDSLAVVVTDKNGQVVVAAKKDMPSWGQPGDIYNFVDPNREVFRQGR